MYMMFDAMIACREGKHFSGIKRREKLGIAQQCT